MTQHWDLANPQLRDLAVYEPGKPIEETARELGVDPCDVIKLASNENPLGPSPRAIAAVREAMNSAQLYPDGGAYYLREALAAQLGLQRANLIMGSGSNEVIEFLGHGFLRPGDEIITSQYAFIVYKLIAQLFGAHTVETPSPDYRFDLDAMLAAITPKTRIIFIANPNNPTGTLVAQDAIDRFMARVPEEIVIVFDEAYFEFLDDPPDTLRYLREGRNVVVLRTFSKIHGLASLRVGYGMAPPELIAVLQKTRQPFNVNGIGQIAALAALQDKEHQARSKQVVDEGRAYLEAQFRELGLCFMPSHANFVTVEVGHGPAVFKQLLACKIIVRPVAGYQLPAWVRISVGTMEQNQQCIAALRNVLAKNLPA
ncbi:MAG TPA: histidinol-phosphate transaminase [Chthoniobacterales bacterium]